MPGHKDKAKKKKAPTNRPAKKNRVKKPSIGKPKNPFQRKNKKKNNREMMHSAVMPNRPVGGPILFVQNEQEMNQAPGGRRGPVIL